MKKTPSALKIMLGSVCCHVCYMMSLKLYIVSLYPHFYILAASFVCLMCVFLICLKEMHAVVSPHKRTVNVCVMALLVMAAQALSSEGNAQNTVPSYMTPVLQDGSKFEPANVVDAARQLAKKPFQDLSNDLPEPFNALNFEAYNSIRTQPNAMIWEGEGRGIVIEPLHRGFAYSQPVNLFQVDQGMINRIRFSAQQFDYTSLTALGKNIPAALPDLQFSGFKIRTPDANGRDSVVFQGATFFRAIGFDQTYGQISRALTLRASDAKGEEVPVFRAFWIEKPVVAANEIIIHALMDSISVAASARFIVRPNTTTIIDVEMTFFPRITLDHVGIASSAGSFLFSRYSRRFGDDIRAGAYEVSGLHMRTGRDEWIYRPVTNPDVLLMSVFDDTNPKGFGLVQRERDFFDFQDEVTPWQTRPSMWIEPLGDWGEGAIQLLEIPAISEINDNILAYWRPKKPYAAGSEVTIAYRQYWGKQPPERPSLAQVSQTRTGRIPNSRSRRLSVDFSGEIFAEPILPAELRPLLWVNSGTVSAVRYTHTPERKTLRATFDLDPAAEKSIELRLVLETRSKTNQDVWNPITETWLYRWTP